MIEPKPCISQELGPTFVKLGQVLSIRPDVLPEKTMKELARLQDAETVLYLKKRFCRGSPTIRICRRLLGTF